MSRYKVWLAWQKRHLGTRFYKLMVLLGIIKSPTFEHFYGWYKAMEENGQL